MYHGQWAKAGLPPVSVQLQFSELGHVSLLDAALLELCSSAWRRCLKTKTKVGVLGEFPAPAVFQVPMP